MFGRGRRNEGFRENVGLRIRTGRRQSWVSNKPEIGDAVPARLIPIEEIEQRRQIVDIGNPRVAKAGQLNELK